MNFSIKNESRGIVVASTRPELLFACQAVIVNPNDKRYADVVGKRVAVPLFDKEVPVYAHHSARPELELEQSWSVAMAIRMMFYYLESLD